MHDTRDAREHVMDELAPFVSRHTRTDRSRRPTVLGDKGCTGLDIGVLTPTNRRKGVHPHVDEVTSIRRSRTRCWSHPGYGRASQRAALVMR